MSFFLITIIDINCPEKINHIRTIAKKSGLVERSKTTILKKVIFLQMSTLQEELRGIRV